jgi:hypothetical protein
MRNPYLLLGVDYGVAPDEARRRFARAARRVRRAPGSTISIEDLNWALHEVQSRTVPPADDVETFRVPANPAVFAPGATGVFSPPAVPFPRTTTTSPTDLGAVDDGLAADVGELVGAVVAQLATFGYGYRTQEGGQI